MEHFQLNLGEDSIPRTETISPVDPDSDLNLMSLGVPGVLGSELPPLSTSPGQIPDDSVGMDLSNYDNSPTTGLSLIEELNSLSIPEIGTDSTTPLTPMPYEDFIKLVKMTEDIREAAEIKELKARHEEHFARGLERASALVAGHDIVGPDSQRKILDLYGITLDTFDQARSSLGMGQKQNLARSSEALQLGLPVNASRKQVSIEKDIREFCANATSEIQ